ncbi:glutathione reductase [Methyloceanibacter methanicus]|uniref:Glutathione reductase n=1 Tax=Methyloceanibacter methanicus TaxID=1774968 RepID=A0A1E3VYY1_9HYPH|nr:glutathione-disulfide reductase [Methyloceanibacter methanicus]ODR98481.1 glutathione reductase [Methyloceanibacter methanicus]
MSDYDYDLFVIGGGSGGVRAARLAAQLGKRVAIAEEYRIGGTCVIRGCVPKKLLVYGSRYGAEIADAAAFGWSHRDLAFDWPTLIHNVQREVDRLNGVYTRTLENAGVDRFLTRATLDGPHRVKLEDRAASVSAEYILVATGSVPSLPDIPGTEHFISSNECFQLEALPESIVILGAGYIGMEFASIFAGLGVAVTVVHRGDQILRGFDIDLCDIVAEALRDRGVDLRMCTNITSIEKDGDEYQVVLTDGDVLHASTVMAATGRTPNTKGLGLEAAGVALGKNGQILVDAYSKTGIDNIYAVGDVTNRANLTPVAIREGTAFVETVFEGRPKAMDYGFIPTAVFTEPEIGTVGLTEEEARKDHAVDVYKTSFRPMRATISGRGEKVFMKLVVDAETDKVLGLHMVGPDAAEIVQMAAIPLRLGATKADFDATMALHPSMAEEFVTLRQKWEPPVPIKGSDAAA